MTQKQLTILIVDDDDAVRAAIKDVLTSLGYEVIQACDAEDALHIIENVEVDFVITDLNLPGIDGNSLLDQIMAPGILLTGQSYDSNKVKVLHKPVGVCDLTDAINVVLN